MFYDKCIICGKSKCHSHAKTCSLECRKILQSNNTKSFRMLHPIYHECIVCGKKFLTKIKRKTCSKECFEITQKREHEQRHEKALQTCVICGKKFFKKHKASTCSKECDRIRRSKASIKVMSNIQYKEKLFEKVKAAWTLERRLKHGEAKRLENADGKIQEHVWKTKKEKGVLKKSKEEENIYKLLLKIFPDTLSQYRCDEYPFSCDFYIPSKKLFIEYQGYWTHGKHPFTNSIEDNMVLQIWNSKVNSHRMFKDAIKTWTIRDPLKREIAKKNNLNWLEFFNMKEFMKWYEQ